MNVFTMWKLPLLLLVVIITAMTAGIHGFSSSSSPASTVVTVADIIAHSVGVVGGVARSSLRLLATIDDNHCRDHDEHTFSSSSSSSSSLISQSATRRNFFLSMTKKTAAATATVALVPLTNNSILPANASGGATAGKYTTIPIAKRRYYGRVQEAVHEFLLMAPAIIKGDLTDPTVQDFFDVTKTVVIEGKKRDINGVCTKKDGDCKSVDVYDSRYNDMKTTMYLLGNAFRINQQKAPDNLPTVKAAKKFFKQMNLLERKVLVKDSKTKDAGAAAAEIYATALDYLDEYLDLVELPPTESGHYDQEFSTLVGESSRIT